MDTAHGFRHFARYEARGSSATYERLSIAVAGSSAVIERLNGLPGSKRQPNLLFATAQLLGAPFETNDEFVDDVIDRWDSYVEVLSDRSTQTNEPARTSAFLPLLAQIDGPITLVEVGASAGLCLYPDRYSIRYGGHPAVVDDSPVRIDVVASGPVPLPTRIPNIVDRIGIDLNPLDAGDDDDVAWLAACVWPEHEHRRRRLFAAAEIAASDPPRMIRADLVDVIGDVIDQVGSDSTPVVIHSAVLSYLARDRRDEFTDRVRERPRAIWISNEGPGVIDGLSVDLAPPEGAPSASYFVVASESIAVAISDPHGAWLQWRSSDSSQ